MGKIDPILAVKIIIFNNVKEPTKNNMSWSHNKANTSWFYNATNMYFAFYTSTNMSLFFNSTNYHEWLLLHNQYVMFILLLHIKYVMIILLLHNQYVMIIQQNQYAFEASCLFLLLMSVLWYIQQQYYQSVYFDLFF